MSRDHLNFVLVAFLSVLSLSTGVTEENPRPTSQDSPKWPKGDYHYCLVDNLPHRLEVLPGLGWDNLLNRDSGMVAFRNYSLCKTTEDGRYLIPDDVYVLPIKESVTSLNSELIDHWSNYTSTTSKTINGESRRSSLLYGSISGSFSAEYQDVKKQQVEEHAITSRVELRYRMYGVKLQPDPQLHPKFKSRLLDIGANLRSENFRVARYLSELLVRDYGTHYVKHVEAGGILSKVDHVNRSLTMARQQTKNSASSSFRRFFGETGSNSLLDTNSDNDLYNKNVKDSKIFTFGGPPAGENFSIASWEDGLENNLVAIDRQGDPLHNLITPNTLPELMHDVTFMLSKIVLESLQRYYRYNAITGCMDAESPNFNFEANLDDQSCKTSLTNFTFGGVYQTCNTTGSPPTDLCADYTQKNPKTQEYSCPSGYTAVPLYEGTLGENCQRECHKSWIFKSCQRVCSGGKYSMFWCAALGTVPQESGYLFGGLYSNTFNNVITKNRNCPMNFYPQRFGPKGMYVCISDNYELGAKFSLPFGGFMSCSAGNPLAMASPKGLAKLSASFGGSNTTKHCPVGYSQHLAGIVEDCEITYCIKTGSMSTHGLPAIRRPPFNEKPTYDEAITFPLMIENNDTSKVYIRKEDGEWKELSPLMSLTMSKKAKEMESSLSAVKNLQLATQALGQSQSSEQSSSSEGLSAGATAGISICVTLLVGIVFIAFFVRRYRSHDRETSINGRSVSYQSLNT